MKMRTPTPRGLKSLRPSIKLPQILVLLHRHCQHHQHHDHPVLFQLLICRSIILLFDLLALPLLRLLQWKPLEVDEDEKDDG